VAEGVEREPDVVVLRALGCDVAQGFYFGRPLAAADFDVWRLSYEMKLREGVLIPALP
jgi:EAL domain-containing protein (putative c-di-GMP-specific phosphodiesterase class I)